MQRWNRSVWTSWMPSRRPTQNSLLADRQMTGHLLPLKLPDRFLSNRAPAGNPNSHYSRRRRRNKAQRQLFPGYDPHLRLRDGLGYRRPKNTAPVPSSSPLLETDPPRRLRSRLRTNRWVASCPEASLVSHLHSLLQPMNQGRPLPLLPQHLRNHDRSRALRRSPRRLIDPHLRPCLRNLRNSR